MKSSITVSELSAMPAPEVQLVDVRSPSEFASGHVSGAVNIPLDQIEGRLEDLRSDVAVVLICQAGKRARITADLLGSRSRDVAVLEGGTNAWSHAGLPLVCCIRTRWSLERQVRLIAGLLALTGAVLALVVNPTWVFLSGLIGLGLTFAGLTDICPMGILLGKMPWNRNARCSGGASIMGPIHDR